MSVMTPTRRHVIEFVLTLIASLLLAHYVKEPIRELLGSGDSSDVKSSP